MCVSDVPSNSKLLRKEVDLLNFEKWPSEKSFMNTETKESVLNVQTNHSNNCGILKKIERTQIQLLKVRSERFLKKVWFCIHSRIGLPNAERITIGQAEGD